MENLPTKQQSDLTVTQKQYPTLNEKVNTCIAKYGGCQQFAQTFPMAEIPHYASNPVRCIVGTAPSLYTMAKAYGDKYPIQWLCTMFTALSEFTGANNKITPYQLTSLAYKFYARHNDLKATEVMLFIDKVGAGDFGKIAWKNFDPVAVLEKVEAFRQYAGQVEQNERQRLAEIAEKEHKKTVVPMPDSVRQHLQELLSEDNYKSKQNAT